MTPWPALVLTAGLGTRARPLTYDRAKAAFPVAGEALVRRIIGWLQASGIRELVLNLHHLPATITAEVGDGADLGVQVRYSWEMPLLGSAGGPRRALPLLEAPSFFLINGDTLTDVDLGALADAHGRSGALVTMALIPNPAPDEYGGVLVAEDGAVVGFTRRGAGGPSYHLIGAQAVQADAFAGLPDGVPDESVGRLYPELIARQRGCVRAFVCDASFLDIGTPSQYLATSLAVAEREQRPETLVGHRSRVSPGAVVTGSVLWDDVEVGPGARLTGCVVGDGVRIPPGARLDAAAIVRAGGRRPAEGERIVDTLLIRSLRR